MKLIKERALILLAEQSRGITKIQCKILTLINNEITKTASGITNGHFILKPNGHAQQTGYFLALDQILDEIKEIQKPLHEEVMHYITMDSVK